jgi:hypothetical protein
MIADAPYLCSARLRLKLLSHAADLCMHVTNRCKMQSVPPGNWLTDCQYRNDVHPLDAFVLKRDVVHSDVRDELLHGS